MTTSTRGRRPNGAGRLVIRTVRLPDDVWESTKARAWVDGVTVSYVARLLLEGYASGLITLPGNRPTEVVD